VPKTARGSKLRCRRGWRRSNGRACLRT
jgi:hypothetical protein